MNSISALRPKRNVFNLSYDKKYNCDYMQLIPVFLEDCVPGDTYKISYEAVVRTQPLHAPILHSIDLKVEYFFVPYRLLMEDGKFLEFLTGGKDGTIVGTLPQVDFFNNGTYWNARHLSLWDYFGFPCHIFPPAESGTSSVAVSRFPWSAYHLIWNNFYRDENLQTEMSIDKSSTLAHFTSSGVGGSGWIANQVLSRCWKKDYFVSCLPWQQRGTPPSFPLTGFAPVVFGDVSTDININKASSTAFIHFNPSSYKLLGSYIGNSSVSASTAKGDKVAFGYGNDSASDAQARFLQADLSNSLAGFDISFVRTAFQVQKWLERNARSGVAKWSEFLLAHFGVAPRDEVLQLPQYLGGSSSPIFISEVLQTSESTSTSPQGNLAGKGLGASRDYICTYNCKEYGLIMGLASIVPKPSYCSQGINRKWTKTKRLDFYFPEFAHESDDAVLTSEVCVGNDYTVNNSLFGYQGIYDNMRHNRNEVCGDLRGIPTGTAGYTDLSYWHLARKFANPPALNADFVSMSSAELADFKTRSFSVVSEPGFIVDFANIVKALRPLPQFAEPGLVDHF